VFDVVISEDPINIVYAGGSLPLHMDLLMYESPPGIQLLHCLKSVPNIYLIRLLIFASIIAMVKICDGESIDKFYNYQIV